MQYLDKIKTSFLYLVGLLFLCFSHGCMPYRKLWHGTLGGSSGRWWCRVRYRAVLGGGARSYPSSCSLVSFIFSCLCSPFHYSRHSRWLHPFFLLIQLLYPSFHSSIPPPPALKPSKAPSYLNPFPLLSLTSPPTVLSYFPHPFEFPVFRSLSVHPSFFPTNHSVQ